MSINYKKFASRFTLGAFRWCLVTVDGSADPDPDLLRRIQALPWELTAAAAGEAEEERENGAALSHGRGRNPRPCNAWAALKAAADKVSDDAPELWRLWWGQWDHMGDLAATSYELLHYDPAFIRA